MAIDNVLKSLSTLLNIFHVVMTEKKCKIKWYQYHSYHLHSADSVQAGWILKKKWGLLIVVR